MTKNKNHKAFSLIEISMVILVIGILIAGISNGIDLYKDMKITRAQALTNSSRVSRVPDLLLWLDSVSLQVFDKLPTQNEKIAKWKDINPLSINKLEGYQTNDSFKPSYNYDSISGLPALKFNSACMRIDLNISYLVSPKITVFAVFKINGKNASSVFDPLFGNDNGGWDRFLMLINMNGFSSGIMSMSSGAGLVTRAFNIALDNPYYLTYVSQQGVAGGSYVRYNGTSFSPHTENFNNAQNSWINLGSDGDGANGGCDQLANFDIGEFIIYDRNLTTKEIVDIEAYLKKKWMLK
jgi:prepilin-type N-terminal cleavage/methylation domain-containing protein